MDCVDLAFEAIKRLNEIEQRLDVPCKIFIYDKLNCWTNSLRKGLEYCSPFEFEFNGKTYYVYITTGDDGHLVYLVGELDKYQVIKLDDHEDSFLYSTTMPFKRSPNADYVKGIIRYPKEQEFLPEEFDGMLDALQLKIH